MNTLQVMPELASYNSYLKFRKVVRILQKDQTLKLLKLQSYFIQIRLSEQNQPIFQDSLSFRRNKQILFPNNYNYSMQYHYSSHIRNLEEEAYLQKQKISAQLHESAILKHQEDLASTRRSRGLATSRSRQQQDQEIAAYLQRSRLQAELSAAKAKAESSMNRSRLEAAFQIRKENQKAYHQLSEMDFKHETILQKVVKEEAQAHHNFIQSTSEVQARMGYEDRLLELQGDEQLRARETERVYRQALFARPYQYW